METSIDSRLIYHKPVVVGDDDIDYGVCRYRNTRGYTCYMNSMLAILQQTPLFVDYIVGGKFKVNGSPQQLLIFQLLKLFDKSLSKDDEIINPIDFYQTVCRKNDMWAEYRHQDTQEFFNFMINTMEEEVAEKVEFLGGLDMKKYKNDDNDIEIRSILSIVNWQKYIKNEFSPLKMMFNGMLINTKCCEYCEYKTDNFDIFQCLQLSIPESGSSNIYECLDKFIETEQLDESNKAYCEFCFEHNKSFKTYSIWKTPQILVIQLKRFKMNDYGMVSEKINTTIDFPIEKLDLSKYISNPEEDKYIYNLFGVNYHHSIGRSRRTDFGHYTSAVRSRYDNKWYHYDDDSRVEKLSGNDIINEKAYLLFYLREK